MSGARGGGGGGGSSNRQINESLSVNCFRSRQNMNWMGGKELKYMSYTD